MTIREKLVVEPGSPAGLAGRDPGDRLGFESKNGIAAELDGLTTELRELQERLWAESRRSLLLVLQGMDTSGKDGTIRHVFRGVNPQACRVASFKVPTEAELAHDFLWRVHAVCPAHGQLGIFNRSHYEDVVVVRVKELVPEQVWRPRYAQIREFERLLVESGTTIVKVFLHISKDEQRERLQERLDDPLKTWKFRLGDLDDRRRWDDFQAAYEDALTETSTEWAPWYVVPANSKRVRNLAVARLLVGILRDLDPQIPPPPDGLDGIVVE
ncbi:MAG: PPK2 family polyphosphate kinase [Gaiellales bacterium]